MVADKEQPLEERKNSSASEVSSWISALETQLIPVPTVARKRFGGQFSPNLLEHEELFFCVAQLFLSNSCQSLSNREVIFFFGFLLFPCFEARKEHL